MNSFLLKLIACFSMLFDHIGYLIFKSASFFNYIGRLAFPIFAFQITEGYLHTKNLKKYMLRLLVFAIISQIPFMIFNKLFLDRVAVNVMFTLLFGLGAIVIFDKFNKFLGIFYTIIIAFFAEKCHFDYGAYGISIIMIFYIFKDNSLLKMIAFLIATFIKYATILLPYSLPTIFNIITTFNPIVFYAICTGLSIIPILLYNGQKGKDIKYFLYLFYPIHLLILSELYIICK